MDNFNLKKYLTEGYLSENTGKVLVDKVEPRWIIAEPDNITIGSGEITYYKRKANAEKELDDLMSSAEIRADKLRDEPEYYDDIPDAKAENEELIRKINNSKVIEVEMQVKITVK